MDNLENIQDSDVATTNTNETFPLVSTSKTKKTIVPELTEFEEQVIAAAASKPVDRVCALFSINEFQLKEILDKAPNNYTKPCNNC